MSDADSTIKSLRLITLVFAISIFFNCEIYSNWQCLPCDTERTPGGKLIHFLFFAAKNYERKMLQLHSIMHCHFFCKILVFIDAAIRRNEEIKTRITVVPSPPVLSNSRITVSIRPKMEMYLTIFVVFINVQLGL